MSAKRLFFQAFAEKSDSFTFCETGLILLNTVLENKTGFDLIIQEYELYKNFSSLIYDIFRSKRIKIPIIAVGDKKLSPDDFETFWISRNEYELDIQSLHSLLPLFKKISTCLGQAEIKNIFYDTSFSAPFFSELSVLKQNRQSFMDYINKNTCFPPSAVNLLTFLYENRYREVSIEEIIIYLNIRAANDRSSHNSAYCYLSRLRKMIDRAPQCPVIIRRTKKGFYRLIVK